MKVTLVALDLAKESIEVFCTNEKGARIGRRKVSRKELFEYVSRFPEAKVVMEACGSAHHWGRKFAEAGFSVGLIPARHVAPYRRGEKNDSNDARAIAAAASRDDMTYVSVKSLEQQSLQSWHRVRESLVARNTEIMNQMRGLLAEFGVTMAQGRKALGRCLAELDRYDLPSSFLRVVRELWEDLLRNEQRVQECTDYLEQVAKTSPECSALLTLRGVGPITATALYAKGGAKQFSKARQFAASFGVVPRQNTTGGKEKLGKITKTGDAYIRRLVVHGARSVLKVSHKGKDPFSQWAYSLRERLGYCKAAVALANRNLRIVWAILTGKSQSFDPFHIPSQFCQKKLSAGSV
jgi:transposase